MSLKAKHFISDVKGEFKGYNLAKLKKDILAGLTVTAVSLPLSLAFGVNSGVSALAGIICSIISGFLVALLCGGSFQISGPTGAMSSVLIILATRYGPQGVFVATVIAGIFLILCGVLKLGKIVSFIPIPVITGFTTGLGLIIILGQIENFFGVQAQGSTVVTKLLFHFTNGFSPNWVAVIIGVAVIAFMFVYPQKLASKLSPALIAIVVVTAIHMIFKLPVAVVGEIPATLLPNDRLSLGSLDLNELDNVVIPGISLGLLCMIESLLCGASGGRATGKKFDGDKELIAQGLGNMVIPLFGGIPCASVFARTSVAIKSDAQTRVTSIVQSLCLLACMFLLAPIMSMIPLSALAGVLIVTAIRMNDWKTINYLFKHKVKSGIVKYLITMLATVVFDLTTALIVGCVLAMVLFVKKIANIQISTKSVNSKTMHSRGVELTKDFDKTKIVYITGPMFFGAVDQINHELIDISGVDTLIFSMRGVPFMDISAAQTLYELCSSYKENGVELYFCGVCESVLRMMDRTGTSKLVPKERFYFSVDRALIGINGNADEETLKVEEHHA